MKIRAKYRLVTATQSELDKRVKENTYGKSFESMLDTFDTLIAEYGPERDNEKTAAAIRSLAPALKKGIEDMQKVLKGSGWQLAERNVNIFRSCMTEDIGEFITYILIRLHCSEKEANEFGYMAGDTLKRKI